MDPHDLIAKQAIASAELTLSRVRKLLYALVAIVILEGLTRKLVGPRLGNWIFLAKDALTFVMCGMLFFHRYSGSAGLLMQAFGAFFFAMLVPFAQTLANDPVLALFGLKQYVLFPYLAFAFWAAFKDLSREQVRRFFGVPSLLLVPVTLLALLQLRLPTSHWTNLSVGGTSMAGFGAGGQLRVSSTFPFVAQYAMFLNAMVYLLGAFLFLRSGRTKATLYVAAGLCGLLIVSSFVTGSRTAVLGSAAILCIAGVLLLFKGSEKGTALFIGLIVLGAILLVVTKKYVPQAFEAYDARSADTATHTHKDEIKDRMAQALFGWRYALANDAPATMLGYGLGVMSNGSDKISSYAASWRTRGVWGEVDLANTLFEGGWYLVLVWMAFRLFTVLFVVNRVLHMRDQQLALVGCLAAGYVTIEGILGTLGIQPPLSIWFWLAVGTVLVLEELDQKPEAEEALAPQIAAVQPFSYNIGSLAQAKRKEVSAVRNSPSGSRPTLPAVRPKTPTPAPRTQSLPASPQARPQIPGRRLAAPPGTQGAPKSIPPGKPSDGATP